MITRSDQFELEFGHEVLHLRTPEPVDILSLPDTPPLKNPRTTVQQSLSKPLAGHSLPELARLAIQRKRDARAVIVVSDNTRPVPYRGDDGILEPVVDVLRDAGIGHVTILVATGTHRPLTDAQLRSLLPDRLMDGRVTVMNHDCRDPAQLRLLGRTARGTEVWINRHYLDADMKILTGLVEPHFMAGMSGGPKSICPGLVGEKVTYGFHGAAMIADPRACSLNMDNNPCQEEARAVAAMAGSDFAVNVTINRGKRLTGVFAGELGAVHRAACAKAAAEAAIAIEHPYDAVITHAGFSGINHYQAAKAAVEASHAVRPGGLLVLAANHTDVDPVGGPNYRSLLPLLNELGPDGFDRRVLSPDWEFVPEQWEIQMWGRVFRKLGSRERLIYCSPRLTGSVFRECDLPGMDGGIGIERLSGRDLAEVMVQRAIDRHGAGKTMAVLADGPYGVPTVP